MNAAEILRIVDTIHRDKNIDKEIVFEGIEQAIYSALRKYFGEEDELSVEINRDTGEPEVQHNGELLEPDLMGRIAAQTAKQVMIQKIREAERDTLYEEFSELKGQLINGTITRFEGGVAIVNIGRGSTEAMLPKSEQIPGESHRVNERIRAVVLDVRKSGSRVKIVLSRNHQELVRRLFEVEIPEVGERIIDVRSLAREAGYRSKVAVSCIDTNVDCVGACVGVRGSRIKNIIEELSGERIDIVRWNDSLQVLIPNALQPAEVEDVILCPMLGRVIVLVNEDQLSLAIGKRGQNVRLASKLVGWDIDVMTREELDEQLEESVQAFAAIEDVSEELAENLVSQGFFSFDDLSVIEPDQLAELGGLTNEQVERIIEYADEQVELEEKAAELRKQAGAVKPTGSVGTPRPTASASVDVAATTAPPADVEQEAQTATESDGNEESPANETPVADPEQEAPQQEQEQATSSVEGAEEPGVNADSPVESETNESGETPAEEDSKPADDAEATTSAS